MQVLEMQSSPHTHAWILPRLKKHQLWMDGYYLSRLGQLLPVLYEDDIFSFNCLLLMDRYLLTGQMFLTAIIPKCEKQTTGRVTNCQEDKSLYHQVLDMKQIATQHEAGTNKQATVLFSRCSETR